MIDIRLPKITGKTEKEQLMQIKSYLYQLAEQLQVAFNGMEIASANGSAVDDKKEEEE